MLYENVIKVQGKNKQRDKACIFHIEEIYDHDSSSYSSKTTSLFQ